MSIFVDQQLHQSKYLNNMLEHDHPVVKQITDPIRSFKSFCSAQKMIAGIETMHMVKKRQLHCPKGQPCPQQISSTARPFGLDRQMRTSLAPNLIATEPNKHTPDQAALQHNFR
jgi:hypothetical protein